MRKRIKRALTRIKRRTGGRSWENTPSLLLVFLRATSYLPTAFARVLVAYLFWSLAFLTYKYGLDPTGIALWILCVVLSVYAWTGRMIKRCDELLYQRMFA